MPVWVKNQKFVLSTILLILIVVGVTTITLVLGSIKTHNLSSKESGNIDSSPKASKGKTELTLKTEPKRYSVVSLAEISDNETEPSMVMSSKGQIVVAWIARSNQGSSIGYTFSADRGATFTPPRNIFYGADRRNYDPAVSVDNSGNFYLVWIGTDPLKPKGHVYISKAIAESTEFGTPVKITADNEHAGYDKPWITVTNRGTIVVTYTSFAKSGPNEIWAAQSKDGVIWGKRLVSDDGVVRGGAYICAPKKGNLIWITYFQVTPLQVFMRWSDDEGATWSTNETTVPDLSESKVGNNPTCVGEGNNVWVVYGPGIEGGSGMLPRLTSIRLAHSGDGGQTIDKRVDVQDEKAGKFYLHPQISLATNGDIDLVYYAGQGNGDVAGRFVRSRSTDRGATVTQSKVLKEPIQFEQSRTTKLWLGDYVSVVWHEGRLFTAFADNSSGASHIALVSEVATP